ncbi:cytochrome P450 [Litorivita sp. NS0012-18]|uniref:cytochrome P450 n=1 Tax=Litorivita sp. NS0012-18 TaxID=3127655 RepID=UPI0031075B91
MTTTKKRAPSMSVDLYSDENLMNPYPVYDEIRELGPVVYLEDLDMYVSARYDAVRTILTRSDVFVSYEGVMMNDPMNEALKGIVLCTDGDEHAAMRKVLAKPVMPKELRSVRPEVEAEAETLADRLVAKGRFDAATELAQHLPLTIVSKLVGLPEEGRQRMMIWAEANFQCFGPMNARTEAAFPVLEEMVGYALNQCVRGKLVPGGWAERLHDAAEAGEIPMEKASLMALDYLGPSLDTTIFGIGNAVWLFANNPDQWAKLREQPTLIPQAINEVLRLESPIQGFSRYTKEEFEIEDVTIPKDARVIVLYGAGNRDGRKFPEPEKFDIMRESVADHLAFGHGEHACVGMNLARLEMSAILKSLCPRVEGFEVHETERNIINVLRGFSKIDISVH